MKQMLKRLTALILAMSMALSLLCSTAWAQEVSIPEEAAAEVTEMQETEEESSAVEAEADEAAEEEQPAGKLPVDEAEELPEAELPAEEPMQEEVVTEEVLEAEAEGKMRNAKLISADSKVTWSLSDGVLTLGGSGPMPSFKSEEDAPWYMDRESITTIKIGSEITSISRYAFFWCPNLKGVTIPAKVETIGLNAFYRCESMTYLNFASGSCLKEIGGRAFYACHGLTDVVIPDSVTIVGKWAFENCDGLTSVVISSNISEIRDGCFSECRNLSGVIIPDGVTKIGRKAFYMNRKLTEITIPAACTEIGEYAFKGDSALKKAEIQEGSKLESIQGNAFGACTALTEFKLPATVTRMNDFAFTGCKSLKVFDIPDDSQLAVVELEVLSNCPLLTEINLPDSVRELEYGAFKGCTSLSSVRVSNNITLIGNNAFEGCSSLTTFAMPEQLGWIGNHAFYGCKLEGDLILPDAVEYVGDNAFRGNHLETLVLSKDCIVIGSWAFAGNRLTSVRLNAKLHAIYSGTFAGCQLKTVEIPNSVVQLVSNAFDNNSELTTVKLGAGLDQLEETHFTNCPALEDIYFYGSTVKISPQFLGQSTQVTIHGYAGSTAEALANEKQLPFVPIETKPLPVSGWSLAETEFVYDGWYQEPEVIAPDGLAEGYDYQVTYDWDSNRVGEHKVVISGSYGYTGSVSLTYHVACAVPRLYTLSNSTAGVVFKWYHAGASKYRVFRKVPGGTYTKLADVTSNYYTDTTAKSGTKYVYTVRCLNDDGTYSCAQPNGISILRLANPTLSGVTNTSTGVKVAWAKTTGAAGYYVYRKTESMEYEKIKTISSPTTLSWTDTTAVVGTKYTYMVRAYSGTTLSSYAGKSVVRLLTPSITRLTNVSGRKMKVIWGKKSGVTGYQIQYSTSSSFAKGNKTVTVTGASTVSKTISSLTKGKTYYVRIRTYKTVSGTKYYSGWSGKKSVKISR